MINLRKSVSPPPTTPCKKTCPRTILPPPFFSFSGSLPLTPLGGMGGGVIKIYCPSLFKVVGGEGESNFASAPSPCQNENFVNTSKKVL